MSTENKKIFFSYSRADQDFVVQLAKDLRTAGANIWLDQLDIDAGERWDNAIEEALETAACVVAVLSPTAVMSHNVMDEIAYALEENKQVAPVIRLDCKIPLRLRRLQHIDFTGDYNKGFRQLLHALDIGDSTPSARLRALNAEEPPSPAPARQPVDRAEQAEAAPQPAPKAPQESATQRTDEEVPAPSPATTPPTPRPPHRRRFVLGGSIAAVVIAVLITAFMMQSPGESKAFLQARTLDQNDTLTVFEKQAYWQQVQQDDPNIEEAERRIAEIDSFKKHHARVNVLATCENINYKALRMAQGCIGKTDTFRTGQSMNFFSTINAPRSEQITWVWYVNGVEQKRDSEGVVGNSPTYRVRPYLDTAAQKHAGENEIRIYNENEDFIYRHRFTVK